MTDIDALLDKAGRFFAAAKRMATEGDADFAASRAYYGYFYVAEALLLSKELSFSSHSQVIAQYGFHFAKNEILNRRFHLLFRQAFSLRQTANYSTEPAPDPEVVRDLIEGGRLPPRCARVFEAVSKIHPHPLL